LLGRKKEKKKKKEKEKKKKKNKKKDTDLGHCKWVLPTLLSTGTG